MYAKARCRPCGAPRFIKEVAIGSDAPPVSRQDNRRCTAARKANGGDERMHDDFLKATETT
ncbi:MAG: hypothetical protein SO142_04410 [Prevotella sp.]|nr:hypothetical protein [Prevotella sp.]MDY5034136.1 hypothetical protein [Prevotella sp.]